MISADVAIRSLRRDLTVAALLKGLLMVSAVACLLLGPVMGSSWQVAIILSSIGLLWLVLSFRSARGSSLAADSPQLIAAGQFEEAEEHLERSLKTFSLFRATKLLSLHHLALLRHAQRRWQETAELCRALLKIRLGPMNGLGRSSRLILADALLELGDVRGAYEALSALHQHRLPLVEAMNLLVVQLDYESRVEAWASMFNGPMAKVQLAELMPPSNAARAQALLALAAKKMGRDDWTDWLRKRVELLLDETELQQLTSERPALKEVFRSES